MEFNFIQLFLNVLSLQDVIIEKKIESVIIIFLLPEESIYLLISVFDPTLHIENTLLVVTENQNQFNYTENRGCKQYKLINAEWQIY